MVLIQEFYAESHIWTNLSRIFRLFFGHNSELMQTLRHVEPLYRSRRISKNKPRVMIFVLLTFSSTKWDVKKAGEIMRKKHKTILCIFKYAQVEFVYIYFLQAWLVCVVYGDFLLLLLLFAIVTPDSAINAINMSLFFLLYSPQRLFHIYGIWRVSNATKQITHRPQLNK